MSFFTGGFSDTPDNLKKAKEAIRKKLGRKPKTSLEYGRWRQEQKKKFQLW